MKRILFFILMIVISLNSEAQVRDSIPVFEYEINYSLGKALKKKGYVFKRNNKIHYNTTKSVFLEDLKDFIESNDEGIPEINVRNGVRYENVITDIKKNILSRVTSAGRGPVQVQETIVQQKWKSTGVKKKVNGRDCIELVANFRGRKYIAYVDLKVPFYYGPWKLTNFPGLLVSVKDSKNQLSWTLLSVKNTSVNEIDNFVKKQEEYFNKAPIMSLKDFVPLYDASKGGTISLASSRLPRGYKRENSSRVWKRGGMELKYEWEE